MELRIQAVKTELDDHLLEVIRIRLMQLENQLRKIRSKITVKLKEEVKGNLKERIVEMIVILSGKKHIIRESAESFERAFHIAYQSVKRKITRIKEKLQEKH
jgi:ribosome-associated translation inhibitor RaiA